VGPGSRVGKSTVRDRFADLLGLQAVSTSQVLAAILEDERGWPAGTVARERIHDPDDRRTELREVGDRIGPSRRPAGVRALEDGARIVDGIRRAAELDAALRSTVAALCADLRLVDLGGVTRLRLARFAAASHAIEGLDPRQFGPGSGPSMRHLAIAEGVASEPSTMADPREAHFRLMHGLVPPEDLGRYRHGSVLVGVERGAAPGPHLERHMRAWQDAFAAGPAVGESPAYAWRLHDAFEVIHPFADGNGRIGRLILDALRVRAGLPWLTVLPADRPWYVERIRRHHAERFACANASWRSRSAAPSSGRSGRPVGRGGSRWGSRLRASRLSRPAGRRARAGGPRVEPVDVDRPSTLR
jgi:hypothetical protein